MSHRCAEPSGEFSPPLSRAPSPIAMALPACRTSLPSSRPFSLPASAVRFSQLLGCFGRVAVSAFAWTGLLPGVRLSHRLTGGGFLLKAFSPGPALMV